jgi:hypothetical protein
VVVVVAGASSVRARHATVEDSAHSEQEAEIESKSNHDSFLLPNTVRTRQAQTLQPLHTLGNITVLGQHP